MPALPFAEVLHRRDQLIGVRRLQDEVTRFTIVGARHLVEMAGHDDDWDRSEVSVGEHPIVECPAVHAGHDQIENHDAGVKPLAEVPQRILGAPRSGDLEAVGAQQVRERIPGVIVVVNDENLMRLVRFRGARHRHSPTLEMQPLVVNWATRWVRRVAPRPKSATNGPYSFANTAPCNDGSDCTTDDMCSGGTCGAGTPVACDACEACVNGSGCLAAPGPSCHQPTARLEARSRSSTRPRLQTGYGTRRTASPDAAARARATPCDRAPRHHRLNRSRYRYTTGVV
jgi:hypothetical protein